MQDLLTVDDWDFNWQFGYRFATPLLFPKGTVLEVVAHYDNSAANPRNPNRPPKVVKWGEATTDEMCIGFVMLLKKDQDLTRPGEKDDLWKIIQESGGVPALSTPARPRAGHSGSDRDLLSAPRPRRDCLFHAVGARVHSHGTSFLEALHDLAPPAVVRPEHDRRQDRATVHDAKSST